MPTEDKKPATYNEPGASPVTSETPLPDARTSPGLWLLIIGILAGAFVTLFLWNRSEASRRRDDFKPEVVIIHLNDTYRIDALENGKVGGLSRVATLIKQTQAQNKNVLVVHAGDFIAPSLESNVFHGEQMIDALNYLNKLALLYVVPGNHEFDKDDAGIVVNAMDRSDFDWLGSNVKITSGITATSKTIRNNRIISAGRLKLGLFALTIHGEHGGNDQAYAPVGFEEKYLINDVSLEGMEAELPEEALEKVRGLRNREFGSKNEILAALNQATGIQDNESLSSLADYASIGYTSIAEQQIQELENAGADVIIALTHLNMPDDRQLSQLRRAHPKFMWIAGGHEHYTQHEALTARTALITKGDSNARKVWRVALGFNNGVVELREEKIDVNASTLQPDGDYQRIADNYRTRLLEEISYLDDPVGDTQSIPAQCLEGDEETIRNAPSNWGTYIAKQMRVTNGQGQMQIGLLNGGGIRIDDRPCGALSFEHLERTFGFKTEVVYIKLAGEDFKQRILEKSVTGKRGAGGFLQFSGIAFKFDRHRLPGDRVFNIMVEKGSKWVDFDKNEIYSIAVPKFLYECNDGYTFREKIKFILPPGPDVRTLVYNALQGANAKTIKTVKTRADSPGSKLKEGASELPDYVQASVPRITGTWNPPPNNFCPKK